MLSFSAIRKRIRNEPSFLSYYTLHKTRSGVDTLSPYREPDVTVLSVTATSEAPCTDKNE